MTHFFIDLQSLFLTIITPEEKHEGKQNTFRRKGIDIIERKFLMAYNLTKSINQFINVFQLFFSNYLSTSTTLYAGIIKSEKKIRQEIFIFLLLSFHPVQKMVICRIIYRELKSE